MDANKIRVQMLGNFSISLGQNTVDDNGNRSKKMWLLLAYMIYSRSRPISQDELLRLLWGDEEDNNPQSALRTMFHRVRTMLNQLNDSAGHDLIVRRGGNYAWNTQLPLELDVESFDKLCRDGAISQDEEQRLTLYRQALNLYQGDFLSKLSSEAWVRPISAYFHNLYLKTVQETLVLLENRQHLEEVVALCRQALEVDPYNEDLYLHLMRSQLALGERTEVISIYEEMSKLFLSNFGIVPNEEIRAIYYEAVRTVNDHAIPIEVLREQLREPAGENGAMVCDYDFFKVLYYSTSRLVARSGVAVHIGLLSITAQDGQPLPKRSLDRAMDNLQRLTQASLRRGDVIARCSVSQFVLLLHMTNYENSCMVCERIVKAFYRQHPHTPADLRFAVQPLEVN